MCVTFEFDRKTGCITHLIVPGTGKICGLFGRDTEYRIPFCRVCQIGPDIILVDIDEGEKPIRDKEKIELKTIQKKLDLTYLFIL